jgi:3-oxoacyl-[acyl-carrier protein] reductase
MNLLLKDQVAIVTGGNSGIGKAIVLKLAEAGVKIAIFANNQQKAEEVISEIEKKNLPGSACFFQLNVANGAAVDTAVKEVLERFGQVDILVNNAGINRDQLLMKISEEDWDAVMDVNVKSCFNTCKALARQFIKAKKGKIINISSVIGLIGNPGQANYAASKAAMIGFTKSLAKELASRNIRVNCVAPGFIDTGMTETLTEKQKEDIFSKIPMGIMGSSEDIANAVLFLASDLAKYITGQVITVDGGMVC